MIINKTYFDDYNNILPTLPDKSFDAIIADLPYAQTKAKWDILVDLPSLWLQYKRLIKDNGVILLFSKTPFDKILGCSNLPMLKYEWIWEKTQATGFFNAKKMPMQSHENILVFYNKPPKYYPQKTQGHSPVNSYTKKKDIADKTLVYGENTKDIQGGGNTDRYPRTILKFSSDKQKNKLDGTIHPTQKPLALLEYLVNTYTDVGDLILDNVAGSGQTGLAARNLNRNYIMCENDPFSIEILKKRNL